MCAAEGRNIRIEFTPAEVIYLVGLTWNTIKSTKNAAELDWTVVKTFTRLVQAAKNMRIDISKEVSKDGR